MDTKGEWGHGIYVRGAENIKLININVSNCWGDGIAVAGYVEKNIYASKNVSINSCVCDNNRRQGISIISCENLIIDNCITSNTNGTLPSAGIDIEPNQNENAILKNIKIQNHTSFNNDGSGIDVAIGFLETTNTDISIDIQIIVRFS